MFRAGLFSSSGGTCLYLQQLVCIMLYASSQIVDMATYI